MPGTQCGARSDASKQGPKSVPGARCDAGSDASKTGSQNRCQAPGAKPGRMLANRGPTSVPGTRCEARFHRVDEDRSDRRRVAFEIPCKTVASFECSVKGARELAQWLFDRGIQEWAELPSASTLRIPDERFPSGRPMIDIATEIPQSLQARNGKHIGMEEVSVIHPLPWDIRTNAAGYSVMVDATGTEVLLAFGDDPKTSRAVAEFVVRSLLSYSRP